MTIKNDKCPNCTKMVICTWYKTIQKFDPEAKNPIMVDIEIKNCQEFDEVN